MQKNGFSFYDFYFVFSVAVLFFFLSLFSQNCVQQYLSSYHWPVPYINQFTYNAIETAFTESSSSFQVALGSCLFISF